MRSFNFLIGPEYNIKCKKSIFIGSVRGGRTNLWSIVENLYLRDDWGKDGRNGFWNPILQVSAGFERKIKEKLNLQMEFYAQKSWYKDEGLVHGQLYFAQFKGVSRIIGIRLNSSLFVKKEK